ncbi:hypothetical protein GO001_31580 [Streptomyces sp. NRRL B-1677]|nr:hypothetical protein [Streptomyces sp. NRRL B-1677]
MARQAARRRARSVRRGPAHPAGGTAPGGLRGPLGGRDRAGRARNALGPLRALAAEHPWRERVHEPLMTALHQAGRQVDALDVYTHVRRALAEELGTRPGPGLDRPQEKILTAGPGRQTGDSTGLRVPARPHGPAQLPQDTADFTGRNDGADRLCSVLATRQVLVLLDNARDLAQVRDLLPGAPGSAVLLTSRSRLTGLNRLGLSNAISEHLPIDTFL